MTAAEQQLQQLEAEIDSESGEDDFDRAVERSHESRKESEASEDWRPAKDSDGLPSLRPATLMEMRGLGSSEGPHHIFRSWLEESKKVDADGMPRLIPRRQKYRIGPFMLNAQMQATDALASFHEDTFKAALAWSYRGGEGRLDVNDVVDMLDKVYPSEFPMPDAEGKVQMIQRPKFTAEGVTCMLDGAIRELNYDNTYAMAEFVSLALMRFNPTCTTEWVEENFDYGELVRICGKILHINSPLRDRFLG